MRLCPPHSAGPLGQSTIFLTSCRYTLCSLASISFSSVSRRSPSQRWWASERGHVELFQHAFHIRGINSEVVLLLCLYQGSSQVAHWFCGDLATLEFQVVSRLSKDFADDLVRSSQQQVVHVSGTRFVACPQASVKHVLVEDALPEDLLQMFLPTSRCASQNIQTFL